MAASAVGVLKIVLKIIAFYILSVLERAQSLLAVCAESIRSFMISF